MDFREQLKGFRYENTPKYCLYCDSYTNGNKILKLYDKSK